MTQFLYDIFDVAVMLGVLGVSIAGAGAILYAVYYTFIKNWGNL